MTEESRQEQLNLFRDWILEQTDPSYRLYIKEDDPSTIVLETGSGRAEVTFFAQEIIQLSVLDIKTDRHVFYLHFQIHTLEHACSLFEEMREALLELGEKSSAKILLCCASGLTTAFFAEKLNEAASLLSLDYDFSAAPYSELYQKGDQYDIVLIAPQIYYAFDDIKKILPDQIVLKIPAKVFASYDVSGLFEEITPYITGDSSESEDHPAGENVASAQPLPLRQGILTDVPVLAIAMIYNYRRVQYAYRVYGDSGEILFENDVIKPRFRLYDLADICDTAIALFPEINVIGLAMPRLDEISISGGMEGLSDADIVKELTERFNKKVILENSANSIAIGYYASQNKYSSLSVLFQPYIGSGGNIGSIHEGRIITGLGHVAGEVKYLPMYSHPGTLNEDTQDDPSCKWKTPEGALDLATEIMATIISILGPELIVLSSNLIIHADIIAARLEEYIPKRYIPDIVLLYNIRDYMLRGIALACMEHIQNPD